MTIETENNASQVFASSKEEEGGGEKGGGGGNNAPQTSHYLLIYFKLADHIFKTYTQVKEKERQGYTVLTK